MLTSNNELSGDLLQTSAKYFIKYRLKSEKKPRGKIPVRTQSFLCGDLREYLLLAVRSPSEVGSAKEPDYDLCLEDDETRKRYEDYDMIPAASTIVITRIPKEKAEKPQLWKPVTKKERNELGEQLQRSGVCLKDYQTQQQGQHQRVRPHHMQRIGLFKENYQQQAIEQTQSPPSVPQPQKIDPTRSEQQTQDVNSAKNITYQALPDWLECPICNDLIVDAVLTRCCGNSFCVICIKKALTPANVCPVCYRCKQNSSKCPSEFSTSKRGGEIRGCHRL